MFSFFITKAFAVAINPNIPGTNAVSATSGPGAFVANFYQFALLISGILALGAIVYGGVKYAASAGNPSAQSDGKEWILSALYGILLLAGAYLILYTINPNLVNLNSAALTPINISAPSGASGTSGSTQCGGTTPGTCPSGLSCGSTAGGTFVCTGTVNQTGGCGGANSGTCPAGSTCFFGGSGFFCSTNSGS